MRGPRARVGLHGERGLLLPKADDVWGKCQPTKAQLVTDLQGESCSHSLVSNTNQEAECSPVAPSPSSAGIYVVVLSSVPGFHAPGLSIFNPSYGKFDGRV